MRYLDYKNQHQNKENRVCHMIGVPMIYLSLFLFITGWIFQLVGHKKYEKNNPVFAKNPLDPRPYFYGLWFVIEEYKDLLTGKTK